MAAEPVRGLGDGQVVRDVLLLHVLRFRLLLETSRDVRLLDRRVIGARAVRGRRRQVAQQRYVLDSLEL